MKSNTMIGKAGYELASIIWSCETCEELGHLCRTVGSIIPRKYEQLSTLKNIKHQAEELMKD